MSEETTNYGIPNTTLDTEQYPPQTGDLLGGYMARLSAREKALEARIERLENMLSETRPFDPIIELSETQPEPTEEPAATAPTVTRERTRGAYGTRNLTKSKPDHIVDANKKVCAACGHGKDDHIEPAGIHICLGGTLGQPCQCREYKPVA